MRWGSWCSEPLLLKTTGVRLWRGFPTHAAPPRVHRHLLRFLETQSRPFFLAVLSGPVSRSSEQLGVLSSQDVERKPSMDYYPLYLPAWLERAGLWPALHPGLLACSLRSSFDPGSEFHKDVCRVDSWSPVGLLI